MEDGGGRSSGIRARHIKAENVVEGVQFQGTDPSGAARLVSLAREIQTQGIDVDEVIAKNLVSGLQYIDKTANPSIEELASEIRAVHVQLNCAISQGHISEKDAADADEALTATEHELSSERPNRGRILRKLGKAADIITRAAEMSTAAENLTNQAIKLAPLIATVFQVAQRLLGA
jgi:hypothetical protein